LTGFPFGVWGLGTTFSSKPSRSQCPDVTDFPQSFPIRHIPCLVLPRKTLKMDRKVLFNLNSLVQWLAISRYRKFDGLKKTPACYPGCRIIRIRSHLEHGIIPAGMLMFCVWPSSGIEEKLVKVLLSKDFLS
jgi:hypothetical protein